MKIDHGGRTNGQRVFTLGIGANVSRELVNNVARAGCGVSGTYNLIDSFSVMRNVILFLTMRTPPLTEFALEGERMESKVLRLLRYAVQPSAEDIEVDWGLLAPHVKGVSPTLPPPIFNGHLQHVFGIVNKETLQGLDLQQQQQQTPVVVRMRMPPHAGIHEFTIPLSGIHADPSRVIVKLAARSRIKELQGLIDAAEAGNRFSQEKDQLKSEIIDLSTRYNSLLSLSSID